MGFVAAIAIILLSTALGGALHAFMTYEIMGMEAAPLIFLVGFTGGSVAATMIAWEMRRDS